MKELLSIKEKARAYDEAIERANNILEGKCKNGFVYNHYNQTIIEYLFPELKESDNTDIRTEIKNIITYFYGSTNKFVPLHTKEELFAWLEKQGEQKPAWSEEDEELIKWSIDNLTELKDRFGEEYGKVGDCINFLKNLKERIGNFDDGYKVGFSAAKYNQWNPNNEQLEALNAINVTGSISYAGQAQELINLYNDLKKLKE